MVSYSTKNYLIRQLVTAATATSEETRKDAMWRLASALNILPADRDAQMGNRVLLPHECELIGMHVQRRLLNK